MSKLFAGLALACLVTPVLAQDPACQSMDDAIVQLRAAGDTIAGDIAIPGTAADRLVIDVDKQKIWLWASKGGCIIAAPVPLVSVAGAKPKLQGSGLEIGA